MKHKYIGLLVLLLLTGCGNISTTQHTSSNTQGYSDTYKKPIEEMHQVQPLLTKGNTSDGSAKYGALIELGELDHLKRSTYAHIRVTDAQEPGQNGEKRNEKINVDPAGWRNFKLNGKWANNRLHLIGYQFSGLNDELRNLVTGTSYLNKGTEGNGTDPKNPDGMLYYEQQLDNWLRLHPHYALDYYVAPIYEGDNLTPSAIYMQWVGVDSNGDRIAIKIGGHSKALGDEVYGVVLANMSPSYNINYQTGDITLK